MVFCLLGPRYGRNLSIMSSADACLVYGKMLVSRSKSLLCFHKKEIFHIPYSGVRKRRNKIGDDIRMFGMPNSLWRALFARMGCLGTWVTGCLLTAAGAPLKGSLYRKK